MTKKPIYVGLDGGGTSTTLVALEMKNTKPTSKAHWHVLGRVETEGTNVNSVGLEKAKKVILSAFKSLLNQMPFAFHVEGIGCGMAGNTSIEPYLSEWILSVLPKQEKKPIILIKSDTYSALASGTYGDLNGIVLISGTGMNTQGILRINKNEFQSIRAGGWGPLLGDLGSGYEIGRSVLTTVTRMHDGFIPKTTLYKEVLDHFDIDHVDELIGKVYTDTRWNVVASCARLAFSLYQTDECSKKIVDGAAEQLLQYIKHVAQKLSKHTEKPLPLVLCGSILTHGDSPVTSYLMKELENNELISSVIIPPLTPEMGAALMIYHHIHHQ